MPAAASEPQIMCAVRDYIVAEVAASPPAEAPQPDTPLVEAGLIDSLGLFKVIAFIEERFGVEIAPEDIVLENFASLAAIARLVGAKRPA